MESMVEKLRNFLENLTPEELEQHRIEFFPESTTPKGWVSIDDELPMMTASDKMQGYTKYTVKYADGSYGITGVSDHNTWYYDAKESGITHWWNE